MIDNIWETSQDELVVLWQAAIDDLLKHSDDHFGGNDLVRLNHGVHFDTDGRLPLIFISDKGVDIKVDEAVLGRKFVSDLLSEVVAVGTWSNVDSSWLNLLVDISHGLIESLLRVDGEEVGLRLQIWQELLGLSVVVFDLLR